MNTIDFTPAQPSQGDSQMNNENPGAPKIDFTPSTNLTPDESSTALGHSNGLLMNMVNGLGNVADTAGNMAIGALKGAGTTLEGMSNMGQDVAGGLTETQNKETKLNLPQLEPQGTAQGIGKTVEQGAEYLIPAGEEAKAPGLLARAGEVATRVLKNFGIGTSQTGDSKQGAGIALGGEALGALAKPVKALGEGVAKMFIPKSDQEAGILQSYKAGTSFVDRISSLMKGDSKAPSTAAGTAFDKGLFGTESMMGVQAKRAQSKLWTGLVKPALTESGTRVDMPGFFSSAEQKIIQDTPDPTRRSSLLNALSAIKEDFGAVKNIDLAQLQKYKEGWADFVPEKAYKGENIAGALNDVRNTLAGMARQNIYESLGENVKQAYIDYGNLHGITALGKKAMSGAKFKGGAGSMIHGLYEMATVPIGTIGGQTIYKVGQGLEFLGASGAKTLGQVLGITQPPLSDGTTDTPSQ